MKDLYDKQKKLRYLEKGSKDEDAAMKALTDACGGRCFKSYDVNIDIICHTDFIWETPKGVLCSVDKKLIKRVDRLNNWYSSQYTWLELVGNSGLPGSACSHIQNLHKYGYPITREHEYLMLETTDSYIFLQKYKAQAFLLEKTSGMEIVYTNPHKPYIPYQRKKFGHRDVTILVPFADLEPIMHFKILKNTHRKCQITTTK